MKCDEIQARADLSSHKVLLMGTVLQKQTQKFSRLRRGRTGTVGTTNTRIRQRTRDCIDGNIVKLEILVRCSFPIPDVGLIPNFPEPGLNFCIAIALTQMTDKFENEL